MEELNRKLLGSVVIAREIIEDTRKSVKNTADLSKKIETYAHQNTTNLLDVILSGAIELQVSDIHLEPEGGQAKLRIRIDGLLQDVAFFTKDAYHNLLSRLKLLSKLKL